MTLTIIAADDHVLDGFSGAGHVHAVGQVGPPQLGVVHLLLQNLICAEPHNAGNVVILHSQEPPIKTPRIVSWKCCVHCPGDKSSHKTLYASHVRAIPYPAEQRVPLEQFAIARGVAVLAGAAQM